MAHIAQRRSSMDFWADFDVFISVFEESRHRREGILSNLCHIRDRTDPEEVGVVKCSVSVIHPRVLEFVVLVFVVLFGALVLQELRSSEPSPLAQLLIGGTAAFWLGKFCFKRIHVFWRLKRGKQLLVELMEMVDVLKEKLESVETSLKPQRRNLEALVQTKKEIQELYSSVHKFIAEPSLWRLLEATRRSCRAVEQMELLCVDLSIMRQSGHSDQEMFDF